MTTLREAAERALDALDNLGVQGNWKREEAAVAALRKALAQPDPEPVAWMVYTLDGKSAFVTDNPADFTQDHQALPLYTTPPQRQPESEPVVWQFRMRPDWVLDKDFWEPWTNCTKEQAADYQQVPHLHDWTYESRALFTHPPQRKPLTDEEIAETSAGVFGLPHEIKVELARAIERAHGIGGEE